MRSVIGLLLVLPSLAIAQSSSPHWNVRLADGSNTPLVASASDGHIEFRNGAQVVLSIPATSVTHILYMTQKYSRSEKAFQYFDERCCSEQTANGASNSNSVQFDMLPMLAAAVSLPLGKAKDSYVELRWFNSKDASTIFAVDKNDRTPILNWLSKLSGKQWIDVQQERDRILSSVEKRAGEAFPLRILDHLPKPEHGLPTTDYLALPVEFEKQTELLLFEGAVKSRNLAAILPVKQQWADNRCVNDSAVIYRKCDESHCTVDAVLLPTSTYWVLHDAQVLTSSSTDENDCSRWKSQRSDLIEADRGHVLRRAH